MSYRYFNPVAMRFGDDAIDELPEVLIGRRAMIVTFPEAEAIGLVERLRRILGANLEGVEAGSQPNPDVSVLAPMYERFWRDHPNCEAIVAVGGGSTIDTAKALMVGTASGRFDEVLAFLAHGTPFNPQRTKALIAVPTTAGTGSEVTPWATVWEQRTNKKHSLHLPETWPEHAVIDPALMLTLPAAVTLHSGLDALSHALEAIWNQNANPISDNYAVVAARAVLSTLPALMQSLDDRSLRRTMALAALNAGLAFSNTKTALSHSISYEMTLRFGLPHGIACSFTLPMVLKRAIGADHGRDVVLARIFDDDLDGAPTRLTRFLTGLGVDTEFSAYGVDAADSTAMVRRALNGVRGKNFIGARN